MSELDNIKRRIDNVGFGLFIVWLCGVAGCFHK